MKKLIKFGWILLILTFMTLAVFGQSKHEKEIIRILKYSGYSQRHAEYWVKVSKLETGNFNSILFKKYHNPWGMKYTKERKTTHMSKGKKGFAIYEDLNHGIWDIVLYLKKCGYPKDFETLDDFCKFQKSKRYFQEPYDLYYNALSTL